MSTVVNPNDNDILTVPITGSDSPGTRRDGDLGKLFRCKQQFALVAATLLLAGMTAGIVGGLVLTSGADVPRDEVAPPNTVAAGQHLSTGLDAERLSGDDKLSYMRTASCSGARLSNSP